MTILSYIHKLLEEKNQIATHLEPSNDFPYERIHVALEPNLLEITAHPQTFSVAPIKNGTSDSYHLIQFQIVMPLEIPPETFNQVSTSLHFFNRLLHCPGFELDELNNQVLYRYNWFIKKSGTDAILLMQVVGNIQLCFDMFSPHIQEIANGSYTLEDILEQVLNQSKK